jgi:hypothetical protein
MKRAGLSLLAVVALMCVGCSTSPLLGTPPNNQANNTLFFVSGCSTYTPSSAPLNGAECIDTVTGAQYYWNTTSAAFISGSTSFNLLASQVTGITAPTAGTGTVTTGSNNSVMEVTGGTSPVTVTFGTAYGHKPFCVCSNETTAADGCKAAANSNGQTVVVTTAGTDSFGMYCIANGS